MTTKILSRLVSVSLLSLSFGSHISPGLAQTNSAAVRVGGPAKTISSDLFGIFFEDLNYAADGGLYAELVQNRSFEYQPTEQPSWHPLTSWDLVTPDGGRGSMKVADAVPVHPNNPRYAVLEIQGGAAGLANSGFDGIVIRSGAQYEFSMFARQLYTGNRWGGSGELSSSAKVTVRIESKDRTVLGQAELELSGREWQRLAATITATNSDDAARLVVLSRTRGAVALDEISLFPRETFRKRTNGLRPDLAQAIADLKPKFVRFPGGCLVHGYGLGNIYNWKDTIGPVEQRRQQPNLWGYHQTMGLGYYEYFQFCEDIGAKPLPVVAAGVCCQNADNQGGTGQRGFPLERMPAYIQDVLDLIEWANGPVTSKWGAKRAAAGHPEPFNLQYLGVGNEDHITPVFRERFQMIYEAVKAKHPEIIVIGTSGPFWRGDDYENGWKIANELQIPMVDEHYYEKPEWFLQHWERYDSYDRRKSKVYVGEYAAHESNRVNTWRSAMAEAAYMTQLERNGDIVSLASYAPLLAKQGHTQWRPDMIYFDNTRLLLSANYYVQQMFGRNQGGTCLPVDTGSTNVAGSCVRDSAGDVILKLVNISADAIAASVNMSDIGGFKPEAARTVLAAEPAAHNTFEKPDAVVPRNDTIAVAASFSCDLPPHSFTLIRLKAK